MAIISYGITPNYLKHWGINQALREIFQNFIDYGHYNISTDNVEDSLIKVTITNDWTPENLNFLYLGESDKKENSIGQYGEGLKMAMFVFTKLGIKNAIKFGNTYIESKFIKNNDIEVFAFDVKTSNTFQEGFKMTFIIDEKVFGDYYNYMILQDSQILESTRYGDIVEAPEGNIYVGKLFVTNLKGFKNAYNFPPNLCRLDRDRQTVDTFSAEWYASKINDVINKHKAENLAYTDYRYVNELPISQYKNIEVTVTDSGNPIFTVKTSEGNTVPIKSDNLSSKLSNVQRFKKLIKEKLNKLLDLAKGKKNTKQRLKSFLETYKSNLPEIGKAELESIIKEIQ